MAERKGACILTHISGDAHYPIGLGDSTRAIHLEVYQGRRAMLAEQLNTEYHFW
jgi:hypothetical protein